MASSKLIFLVLFAVMITVPGCVSRKCRKDGLCEQSSGGRIDDDIWTVNVPPSNESLAYVDPISGEVKGHYIDMFNAVCEIAGRSCKLVVDRQVNCWDTVEGGDQVGGFGLFNNYYDACAGYLPTLDRLRTFQFTGSLVQNKPSGFIVTPGNPRRFDFTDLSGSTIGFVDGFFSDAGCVARNGNTYENGADLSVDSIVLYADVATLRAGVLAGEVDAGFDSFKESDEVEYLDESSVFCAVGGAANMIRKDNMMKSWFDPALRSLTTSPEYAQRYDQICNDLEDVHGAYEGPDRTEACFQ